MLDIFKSYNVHTLCEIWYWFKICMKQLVSSLKIVEFILNKIELRCRNFLINIIILYQTICIKYFTQCCTEVLYRVSESCLAFILYILAAWNTTVRWQGWISKLIDRLGLSIFNVSALSESQIVRPPVKPSVRPSVRQSKRDCCLLWEHCLTLRPSAH